MKNIKKKTNILILVTASEGGGAEREILDFIEYHNKSKFNIVLVCLKKGNIETLFKEVCKKNKVLYLNLNSRSIINIHTFFKINKIIKKYNIKIINSNLIQCEIYAVISKIINPSLKIISTKHALNNFKYKLTTRLLEKFLSFFNKKIIVVSKSLFNFYCSNIDPKKIIIIPNGIDVKKFSTKISKKDIDYLKEKLGLKNKLVIGTIGRLEDEKNQIILLKALIILKNKIKNIKLIIIGSGSKEKKLKRFAKENGLQKDIIFLDYKKDINIYYKLMDIFCLPSFSEGFGRVIVEALLSEVFVIASNTSGMKEIIKDNKYGYLFSPKDKNDLVKKILKVYNNKSKALKIKKMGKNNMIKEFNIKKIISKKEKLFENA